MTRHVTLDDLKPDAIVFKWHDSGCFGYVPYYIRVDGRTQKFVLLTGENGETIRKSLDWALRELSIPAVGDVEEEVLAKLARTNWQEKEGIFGCPKKTSKAEKNNGTV